LSGADYTPTDNWPVPYRCISCLNLCIFNHDGDNLCFDSAVVNLHDYDDDKDLNRCKN